MAEQEIRDANQAIVLLRASMATDHLCTYLRWCPGDTTAYRVSLLRIPPHTVLAGTSSEPIIALLVMTVLGTGDHLLIHRPAADHQRWTATSWALARLPAGWWPGVRPLLAALGWTPRNQRSTTYRPADFEDITEAYNQRRFVAY